MLFHHGSDGHSDSILLWPCAPSWQKQIPMDVALPVLFLHHQPSTEGENLVSCVAVAKKSRSYDGDCRCPGLNPHVKRWEFESGHHLSFVIFIEFVVPWDVTWDCWKVSRLSWRYPMCAPGALKPLGTRIGPTNGCRSDKRVNSNFSELYNLLLPSWSKHVQKL